MPNPLWWGPEHDFAWDHVKLSLQRSIHGPGAASAGDFPGEAGRKDFPDLEPACRFGYGARLEFGQENSEWNDALERRLREDWQLIAPGRVEAWEQDRRAMHYGWEFAAMEMEEAVN